MVRAVLFDAVGTLIYPDPPVAAVYAAAGRRFGVQIGEEEIRSRFLAAFARQEATDRQRHGLKTDPGREQDRWREIVGDVFRDAVRLPQVRDDLFDELWNHFARPASWRLFDDVEPCWQALEARGVAIAIASNFDDRLERIIQHMAPLDRAKRIFVSARIGYRKPAAEFFRYIERDLGIGPSTLLSVGDDLDNDCRGARAAGWQAIQLDRNGTMESTEPGTIASLDKLPELN